MRRIERSAIVTWQPEQMFDLVADVESYPEFLPWCEAATIDSLQDNDMIASITIGLHNLNTVFTTRNRLDPHSSMTISLADGPFRELEGCWEFRPLGDAGSKISLDIRFEFAGALKEKLFGRVFEVVCNELIVAFVARARSLYD